MLKEPLSFPGDTYETPAGIRRPVWDRIFPNGRFYFYYTYVKVVIWASRLAKKGLYGDREWNSSSHDIFRNIERCGGRFSISGFDHLRACKGPVVIVSNHMSTLETQIFPGLINPILPVTFVVKEKLVWMAFFGPIMRSRDPVTVGRKNPREDLLKVMEDGTAKLKAGHSMIIFPESTRHLDFDPSRFNTLGVKLARRAGVPVLPVALKTDFWGNGRKFRDFGPLDRKQTIHIAFGPAMEITGNEKEVHAECIRFVQDHLREWKRGVS